MQNYTALKSSGLILVVDDDEEDHDIMRAACSILGMSDSLKFFHDGHALLNYLKGSSESPFIILCDINMPHINGLDLREVIWNDRDLRKISIPFIFFSTAASPAQVKKAYDLTVQGFFLKGNSMDETVRKLRLILDYWKESKHPNSFK
jgi:CheY-like chemotaxis protein